jgi:alkanesulfonate monooxygenase SsuD/methylene tetrahydromethanopterin reductase-like flavin-dependent oxidoreductase (luciferase family)
MVSKKQHGHSGAFGAFGVWLGEGTWVPGTAAVAERLGYRTLWIGGSPAADLVSASAILNETEHVTVATGIVNIWQADPLEVAESYLRIQEEHPGRFVLGIGSGHREATPERVRPLSALNDYLDVLDDAGVPAGARLLAALGDKTLALAAERSLGAHPYLTTPTHTAHARGVLDAAVRRGPAGPVDGAEHETPSDLEPATPLLAPELKVALDVDPERARSRARDYLSRYFRLENYVGTLKRFGATDADFAGGGSDELIDEVCANPTAELATVGLRAHLKAGADHVAVQPVGPDPLGDLERVADALGLTKD